MHYFAPVVAHVTRIYVGTRLLVPVVTSTYVGTEMSVHVATHGKQELTITHFRTPIHIMLSRHHAGSRTIAIDLGRQKHEGQTSLAQALGATFCYHSSCSDTTACGFSLKCACSSRLLEIPCGTSIGSCDMIILARLLSPNTSHTVTCTFVS